MSSSVMRDGNAAGAASPVRAFVNSAWTQLLIPPLVVVRWWDLFAQFLGTRRGDETAPRAHQ